MRRDRFGLRLEPPQPATLMSDLAGRLRDVARGPDTPEARAAVAEALESKWWGLRVLAIQAIGRWRTGCDRAWLIERARQTPPTGADSQARGHPSRSRWRTLEAEAALRALFREPPLPEDSGWLLDLWFDGPRGGIGSLWLGAVPEAMLRERVAAEIRGGNPARQRRAIWLLWANGRIANRAEILGHLAGTADEETAKLAQAVLGWLERQRPPTPSRRRPLRSPPPRRRPPPR